MSWGSGQTIPHTGTLLSPLKIIVGRMTISETPHTVRLVILAIRGFRHFVDLIGWTTARYRSMLITIRQKMLVNWLRESGREVEKQGSLYCEKRAPQVNKLRNLYLNHINKSSSSPYKSFQICSVVSLSHLSCNVNTCLITVGSCKHLIMVGSKFCSETGLPTGTLKNINLSFLNGKIKHWAWKTSKLCLWVVSGAQFEYLANHWKKGVQNLQKQKNSF